MTATVRRIRSFIDRLPSQAATVSLGLCLCLCFGLALAATTAGATELPVHDGVGGDFTLQSSRGGEDGLAGHRGEVVLLFFGFTSCPDVCPANLAHLQALFGELGDDAAGTQVLLVTVDPETDTPERLKEYLARFDDRFIGLTGDRADTDAVAKLFMVEHHRTHHSKVTMEHNREKAFVKEGHLIAHSQQIYLIDKKGRTRALFYTGTPIEEMAEAVRTLSKE